MKQHRWELSVTPQRKLKLWRARLRLKAAWGCDQRDPKSYPINTACALVEVQVGLSTSSNAPTTTVHNPNAKSPRTLAKLVPEGLVKAIWEEHHTGKFEDAIRQASGADFEELGRGWKAFQGILNAIRLAYLFNICGFELLPKPKISILHRGLKQIADTAGLDLLSEEGFAEFLDDLCPCGIKQHKGAVRKLSSRSARMHHSKVRKG